MTNNLGKVNIDFRDFILMLQAVVETFALCPTWTLASRAPIASGDSPEDIAIRV
jgi:hypothetical protein